MNPAQWLILEEGFRALCQGGWDKASLMGSRTGVYVGGSAANEIGHGKVPTLISHVTSS